MIIMFYFSKWFLSFVYVPNGLTDLQLKQKDAYKALKVIHEFFNIFALVMLLIILNIGTS